VNPARLLSTAGWGLYCACSWTWCIGMYLPVILLRDLGWPGFLAFAIPNVLGAAAFGYVLASGARSEALIASQRPALRWFSITAVAYHAFFAAFLVTMLSPASAVPLPGLIAGAAVIACGLGLSFIPARAFPILAVIVYAVSLVTLLTLGLSQLSTMPPTGTRPADQLIWLAPVMAFGFLLCPYLDLTFHRALREVPSRHAFAIFGVTFAVMIALTCVYRDHVVLAVVPLTHIAAQSLFTTAAHFRELRCLDETPPRRGVGLALVVAAGALLLVLALGHDPTAAGEAVYVRFLVFYGLIFPAWVLLFVGPGRGLSMSGRNLLIYAVVMIAALPFYEAGFIRGHMWLVPVPVAAIVVWAVVVRFSHLKSQI
ncbi:MAG: hypothetical protein ACYTES_20280, partial [Planctomycetota bacterium]